MTKARELKVAGLTRADVIPHCPRVLDLLDNHARDQVEPVDVQHEEHNQERIEAIIVDHSLRKGMAPQHRELSLVPAHEGKAC